MIVHSIERYKLTRRHLLGRPVCQIQDGGQIGDVPLKQYSAAAGCDVPKSGIDDNIEQGMINFLEIRLEFTLSVDNKSGSDGGEQTGLFPRHGVPTKLEASRINYLQISHVFIGFLGKFTLELVVEFGTRVARPPSTPRRLGTGVCNVFGIAPSGPKATKTRLLEGKSRG